MAGVAGDVPHVFRGHDLREAHGLGRVFFMAAAAKLASIRELRFHRARIGGVPGLRPMAGFAGYVGMRTGRTRLGFVIVAAQAGVLAGVGDGVLADGVQRPRPVVSVLAEGFGHHGLPHYQENAERRGEHSGQTHQM